MKTIPLWKLKRETLRLGRTIRDLPGIVWEYLSLRPRYDRSAPRTRKIHHGAKPLDGEVAIYLIFPAHGILPSHLHMLEHLETQGVNPVVVSNLPLSQADMDRILPLSAMVIQRPNVGYDFGGYRDAVLQLGDILPTLERLYILNDSVWMIDTPRSWFDDVRAKEADFCGATSNYGIRRCDARDFRELIWEYTIEHPNFHYASYALAIGPRILRDPGFLRYWKRFRLSNDKKRTVRRGEIGLTQWVHRKGYKHAATCPVTGLDAEIATLGDDDLDAVTRNLVIPESPRLLATRDEVLKSDPHTPEGRSDRIQIVLATVAGQAIGYAMPYYTTRRRGFQFLKKSPLWLSRDASDRMLELMAGLEGPMGRQAAQEARDLRATRGAALDAGD